MAKEKDDSAEIIGNIKAAHAVYKLFLMMFLDRHRRSIAIGKKVLASILILALAFLIVKIYVTPLDYAGFCSHTIGNRSLDERDMYPAVLCGASLPKDVAIQGNKIVDLNDPLRIVPIDEKVARLVAVTQYFWYVKFITLVILIWGLWWSLRQQFIRVDNKVTLYLDSFFSTLPIFMSFGFIAILGFILYGVIA